MGVHMLFSCLEKPQHSKSPLHHNHPFDSVVTNKGFLIHDLKLQADDYLSLFSVMISVVITMFPLPYIDRVIFFHSCPGQSWSTGQIHTAASLRALSLSSTFPLIPPGIAVRGMALCLGMQHAISLAHPPAVGLRDGTVPTGAPPIIVVAHSLDAWKGGAFPPVQWEPEVHLRWSPYVTQIHTIHSPCHDRYVQDQ
ncbi:hypothetical protein PAMP_000241 [Pampus punctatissimus]